MNMLSKTSAALWLISALASTPAMADLVRQSSVNCGTRALEYSTESAYCSNSGTTSTRDGLSTYDFRIQATTATGYELGGLRTSGEIVFDNLLQGDVGATKDFPAGTFASVQYSDLFRFSFPTAAPGATLTMKTMTRFHGNNYEYVNESVFYDGNRAYMRSEFDVSGFGVPSVNQMASFLTVDEKSVTPLGSSDVVNIFTRSVTVNANRDFINFVSQTLFTELQFFNAFDGSIGVGSGRFGADFSSTAGVLSIDFFDDKGQSVGYDLKTDTGRFAFLRTAPTVPVASVPEPGSGALVLLGLCAVAGFAQRRRSMAAA